jgi:hypothetical protein
MPIILLSQIRDSPNLEGHVPVFISPRNRVVQIYPQTLGSLFVAFYDSQSYGGGIRTRLHTGWFPRYRTLSQGPSRKHRFQHFLYCCVRICCRGNVFTDPFASSDRVFRCPPRGRCLEMNVILEPFASNGCFSGFTVLTSNKYDTICTYEN